MSKRAFSEEGDRAQVRDCGASRARERTALRALDAQIEA